MSEVPLYHWWMLQSVTGMCTVQLGGYVQGSIKGKMRMTQSASAKSYMLNIKSIRIGDSFDGATELLSFRPDAVCAVS